MRSEQVTSSDISIASGNPSMPETGVAFQMTTPDKLTITLI